MDVDTLPHTTTSLADNTNVQFQEVSETIDVLAGGIQALNEDAQRLNNESLRLQNELDALTKDFAGLKLSIQEQTTFLDEIKPSQEILHQEAASLKQKIEDLQSVSDNGSLIWKISNVAEKMGRIFSIIRFIIIINTFIL
jgi:chromosome segregation ATPase